MTTTTRLGLLKPAGSDTVDEAAQLNANFDKIDAAISSTICTSSTRPAGFDGQIIRESDTGRVYIYVAATTTWIPILTSAGSTLVGATGTTAPVALRTTGTANGNRAYGSRNNADAQDRYTLDFDGLNQWGDGTNAPDTNLYRSAANTLKTDDNLVVAGSLTVTGVGDTRTIIKTADEQVTSSNVIQNDDHLLIALPATAVYMFDWALRIDGAAAGDFKYGWTGPAGWATVWNSLGLDLAAASNVAPIRQDSANITTAITHGTLGTGSYQWVTGSGIVTTTTAGSLQMQWAQGTSNATATRVLTNSWLRVTRVS